MVKALFTAVVFAATVSVLAATVISGTDGYTTFEVGGGKSIHASIKQHNAIPLIMLCLI